MSFRIHAAGLPDFNYSRSNCADEDVFEAMAIIHAMRASGPTPVGGAEGVADYVLPSVESEFQSGMQAHLRTIYHMRLLEGVNQLAACRGSGQGWIFVSAHRRRIRGLWADAARSTRYNFMPGGEPDLEFMQLVAPVLTDTSMNNYGVLRQIDMALRSYRTYIGQRGQPRININLYK